MPRCWKELLFLTGVAWMVVAGPVAAQNETLELTGGKWFDGSAFVERTVHVRGGYFVSDPGNAVSRRVDLGGRYVVPPFADAHSHNLTSDWEWEPIHEAYLAEGTFYVLVMANASSGAATMRRRFLESTTVDVAFGNGAVTSTLGYPFLHYEPRAMGLHDPSTWQENTAAIRESRIMENDGYAFIDSMADVEEKLADLLARRGSHLKLALFDSDRFAEQSADRTRINHRGLDPALVPHIVSRAHAAGIRVVAHVETPYDFRVALEAGVDVIAHVPGYNLPSAADPEDFRLTADLARMAAERGVVVTPTVFFGSRAAASEPGWARRRNDLLRHNVALLKGHGVTIVPGTDVYGVTAQPEFEALAGLGLWGRAELLRMWAVDAPKTVFPGRRIGHLEPGYEANFLALDCDPLADLACIGNIALRFKGGRFLGTDP